MSHPPRRRAAARPRPLRRLLAGLALWPALVLAGCSGEGGTGSTGAGADAGEGRPATLTIALQAEGMTLDPHAATDAGSMRLIENMHASLMRYAEDYPDVEKDLLADYEVGEDLKTFTLTLREGLRFHSGRPVRASDVAYSLNRINEKGVRNEALRGLDAIEVVDERTAVLRFDAPMAPLMTYLAHPMWAIVDREVVEANDGRLDRADAGCGPFTLVEWAKDRRCVLERFEGYHVEGLPKVGRLVYRPIPDESARTIALSTGEVDLVLDVPVQSIASLEGEAGVSATSSPGTFWEYLGFNCDEPPFDDARVRRAAAWAVDRGALARAIKRGRATPLRGGHVPPHHWAHADFEAYPEPRPEKARALLEAAGLGEGVEAELIVTSAAPYQVAAAEAVKQMLREVGFDITLRRLEPTLFFQRLNKRRFQMTLVGWVGFVDPDQWLYPIYHSSGAYNQQGYADAGVDALLEEGRATADRDARRSIYRRAQQRIAADAPTVFLYVNEQVSAYGDHVEGFDVHPTGATISLRETSIAGR